MLFVARKENATKKENERLVVVTYGTQVGFLPLQADTSIPDAIEAMQKMFGITDGFTLKNRGHTSQTSDNINGADKISKIKRDKSKYSSGVDVIRLELL